MLVSLEPSLSNGDEQIFHPTLEGAMLDIGHLGCGVHVDSCDATDSLKGTLETQRATTPAREPINGNG